MNLKEYYKALLNEQLNEGANEAARDAAAAAKAKAARNADPAAAEDFAVATGKRGALRQLGRELMKPIRKIFTGHEEHPLVAKSAAATRRAAGSLIGVQKSIQRRAEGIKPLLDPSMRMGDSMLKVAQRGAAAAGTQLSSDAERRIAAVGRPGGDPSLKGSKGPVMRNVFGSIARASGFQKAGIRPYVRTSPRE